MPRVRPFFRWYDLWIGAYWDRVNRTLYVCPVPCVGLKIDFRPRLERAFRRPYPGLEDRAYDLGREFNARPRVTVEARDGSTVKNVRVKL